MVEQRSHLQVVDQVFTCAIVTVHQAGDVCLGLAGHQVRGAELLQHAVVVILVDLPLVVDPRRRYEALH